MNKTVRVLNRLLALHASSLPRYLASAPPYLRQGEEKAWELVQQITDDQQITIDKIADYIEDESGTPDMGEFPAEFTGYHDLSLDFMIQEIAARQRCELELIQQLTDLLDSGTQAKALAQEALGAAKGHLQSIEETLSVTS